MAEDKKKEIDELSGVETTGHEWDGLKELNNPAPRWWLWVFVICVIWAVGYWMFYPAWPTVGGHTKGSLGWTQYEKLEQEQAEITQRQEAWLERFRKANFTQIMQDDELYEFARAGGAVAFKENCAACHGTGAAGFKGYPNLNDDDWIWGGTIEDIHHTLQVGVRSGHEDARQTAMPAFGRDGLLKADEINKVAEFVTQLHGHDFDALAEKHPQGAEIFATQCSSCHGDKGQGNQELGAPKLNDAIWLYGGDKATVVQTITNSRAGVMPHWGDRLDEDTVRQLTIYVHSLGGGQ